MENLFSKNFLQKFTQRLLLLMVLFLGGCNLEFRDKFDIDPQWIEKTFIEYFDNGKSYDGYKYSKETLTIDGTTYTYNGDGDMETREGTFGNLNDDDTKLTATIGDDGIITVYAWEYLDYFVDGKSYGDYIYYSSSTSLKHKSTGKMYRYTGDGDMGTREGTFSSDDSTTLIAKINNDETITITVIEKLFIDNFVDGETYYDRGNIISYTYRASDQSLYYNNEYLTYNDDGGTGTTGTFGQTEISSVDKTPYGIVLRADIVDSTITVTVESDKTKTITFMYDDVEYVYSRIHGTVDGGDFKSCTVDGVGYYWNKVDNKNIYFKVVSNTDIYGVATEGSTTIKSGVSADLYDGVSVTVRNDAICFRGTGSVDLFNGNVDVRIYDNNGAKVSVYGNVNCDFTVQGDLIVYGDLYVNNDSYSSVTGNLYVYGDLTVDGNLYTFGNLYVYGDLTVDGKVTVYGDEYADDNYISNNFATVASEMALTKLN